MSSAKQELEALWRAVFGEPPSIEADPALLSEILVRHMPPAPPYIGGAKTAETASEAPEGDPADST